MKQFRVKDGFLYFHSFFQGATWSNSDEDYHKRTTLGEEIWVALIFENDRKGKIIIEKVIKTAELQINPA